MNKVFTSKLYGLVIAFLTVILLSVSFTARSASALNIAVVDVTVLQQQFLSEVNIKLQDEFKTEQVDLQRKLDTFKDEKEKFEKDAKTMSQTQASTLINDLQKKQNDLQLEMQTFDQKIVTRRQEELKNKLEVLFNVVKDIGTDKKYDMVLAKTAALYVSEEYDITKQVVDGYAKATK